MNAPLKQPYNVQDKDILRISILWFWRNKAHQHLPARFWLLLWASWLALEIQATFLICLISYRAKYFIFFLTQWLMKNREVFSFQTFSWNSFSHISHISILILILLSCSECLIYANLSLPPIPIYTSMNIYECSSGWPAPCINRKTCALGIQDVKGRRLEFGFLSFKLKISTIHKNCPN